MTEPLTDGYQKRVRWTLANSKITCLDCLTVILDVSESALTLADCNLAFIAHSESDCTDLDRHIFGENR